MRGGPQRIVIPEASIRLDSMPVAGRDVDITVERGAREAIAAQLEVTAVDRLQVKLHAVRFRGGIRVTGQLKALVVQPSVVSLEPVIQDIVESVDRIFLPGGEKPYAGKADAEVFVDLEGEDLPDHFEGNEADLSDLIVETLALAIDPYPRLEGETVPEIGDGDDEDDSPFAGLKVLKVDEDKG
jgi:uncharacterized metal-binding protein YceD (DUF177 family)